MDWLRSSIVDGLEDHSLPLMGIPFASVATQSPERRGKDLHNALNWIRHKSDPMYDPTGEFKRLDSLLPRKRDQSLEDRARELEEPRSPEDRRKDVEECLYLLRAGKLDDHDMADEFKKIVSLLPTKKCQKLRGTG